MAGVVFVFLSSKKNKKTKERKVACAAPVSLCYVKAMTSCGVFAVRQVKKEEADRALSLVQWSHCAR